MSDDIYRAARRCGKTWTFKNNLENMTDPEYVKPNHTGEEDAIADIKAECLEDCTTRVIRKALLDAYEDAWHNDKSRSMLDCFLEFEKDYKE